MSATYGYVDPEEGVVVHSYGAATEAWMQTACGLAFDFGRHQAETERLLVAMDAGLQGEPAGLAEEVARLRAMLKARIVAANAPRFSYRETVADDGTVGMEWTEARPFGLYPEGRPPSRLDGRKKR